MNSASEKYEEGLRRLRRYESKTLVKSEYARIHNGSTLSATKATSIVMSMKQGRELFDSAANTDYMTRPIELYYGIASYTRAMTLLLKPNLAENDLKQAHGMKIVSFPTRVQNSQELLDVELEYTNGSMTQWYKEAQGEFMLRVNSSESEWKIGFETDIVSKTVSLKNLLTLIPDIKKELKLLTGEELPHLAVNNYQNQIIAFDGRAAQGQAEACFPGIESEKVTHINNINWRADFTGLADFTPQFVQQNQDGFNIGSTLLVPPLSDLRLSPLATYYSVAYIMSMLARYRPSIWGSVWNGGSADDTYPAFSQLMTLIHDWFPYMLSENITGIGD